MTFKLTAILLASIAATAATAAAAPAPSEWSTGQKIDDIAGNSSELNTPFLDGCPILSPDGRSLYMASNRPGGHGGLDIWSPGESASTSRSARPRTSPSRSTQPRTTSARPPSAVGTCCS